MPIITGGLVIEGTPGPVVVTAAPVDGTDEVQNLEIGGTPTGGTFKLAFQGSVSPAITWSATTGTLLANINAAIQGVAAIQTITFAGTFAGTFRLRYRGQQTAAITWSATNNTLRDNVDTALEALANIGTSGVATAVGSMSSGVGTLTVTFLDFGNQPVLEVADNRSGGAITVATTTAGGLFNSGGKSGIVAADVNLIAGIGNLSLTFSGAQVAKKAHPLMTVAENALTGTTPTLTITETTPGVTATARGILPGGAVVDVVNGVRYTNSGTVSAPVFV